MRQWYWWTARIFGGSLFALALCLGGYQLSLAGEKCTPPNPLYCWAQVCVAGCEMGQGRCNMDTDCCICPEQT